MLARRWTFRDGRPAPHALGGAPSTSAAADGFPSALAAGDDGLEAFAEGGVAERVAARSQARAAAALVASRALARVGRVGDYPRLGRMKTPGEPAVDVAQFGGLAVHAE